MLRRILSFLRRLRQVGTAFFRVGLQQTLAYPLSFVQSQLGSLLPAVIFFFVAKLVAQPGYYTSVVIGLVAAGVLDAGVRGFTREIDTAINRGWLEMFLVEPVRWRFLPFGMALWPVTQGLFGVGMVAAAAALLGARFRMDGLPVALLILSLGLAAGLVIGTLSASLKVLAKSGDPVIFVYGIATQIFSGVYFNLDILPAPLRFISWLLPHTYAIAALRRALLPPGSTLPAVSIDLSVWVLLAFCAVGYPVALWIYGRSLEYGRKLGVLSGY